MNFGNPSINVTYGVTGTAIWEMGKDMGSNNYPIYYQYNYSTSFTIKIKAPFTAIKDNAFTGDRCKDLIKEIVIPKGVTSIGNSAFLHCYFLESITLPNTLETIGDYAFYNCGTRSFSDYNTPTVVKFGKSLQSIGNYAFRSCKLEKHHIAKYVDKYRGLCF